MYVCVVVANSDDTNLKALYHVLGEPVRLRIVNSEVCSMPHG